jgi:hypothetical protein
MASGEPCLIFNGRRLRRLQAVVADVSGGSREKPCQELRLNRSSLFRRTGVAVPETS